MVSPSPVQIIRSNLPGGLYLLRIGIAQGIQLPVGRLAGGRAIAFEPGLYTYIGSAKALRGPSSLPGRLLRHAVRTPWKPVQPILPDLIQTLDQAGLPGKPPAAKRPHWHIDHLLDHPSVSLTAILALCTEQLTESDLAAILAQLPQVSIPVPGFGASDHRGSTHLFRIPSNPAWWLALPECILPGR
jgi:Uri superfamily endonuclease